MVVMQLAKGWSRIHANNVIGDSVLAALPRNNTVFLKFLVRGWLIQTLFS